MWRAIVRPLLLLLTLLSLAASAGANETQVENANPGTTAWQLTQPPTNPGVFRQIEGYASLTSVNVGGSISFFVSTSDSSYTMDFYRIGWYGGAGGREVLGPISRPGGLQPTPSPDAYGTFECNWTNPYVLTVPSSWVSGVYLVKLTSASGWQVYIQFVVREDSRNSVYLFQRSITTDQAYNNWPGSAYGGKSLYSGAVKVSFNRPYGIEESYAPTHYGAGFFPRWEINMVRWMEMNGYDVSYVTDIDVHENPNLLLTHKAFLSVGHDEYWSWQMRANVEAARDAGVGLGFFGGNESYWQIRLESSPITGAADRTQVAYKSTSDPTTNACLMTILWRQNTCKPSEQAFVGVESTAYNVGTNMVIADASNWALAGTGLLNGSIISGAVGYEADGLVQANSPPGTALIAHSPLNSSAVSDTGPYPAYPFSDMVTYTAAASGATVFAVGTIQWSWTLDDWGAPTQRPSILNTAAQRITQNVLARLASAGGAQVPAAPSNLVATAGNTQVGLSWSGSAGATSYNVKRSTTNGGPYTTVASPTGTSYTNTGLNNGTTYYYVVTAVNSAGESGNSNQASATPAQTGGWVPILVNSGGPAYTDTLGQSWSADSGFSGGFSASTASAIQNTSDPKLYQTERYGVFSYSFSVPTGNYNVVLKFAEFYWSSVGQRIFSVSINGTTVLTNFDIVAAAGAPLRAIDKTFPVSVTGGTILIQFIQGSADLPKVSAIEIAQASGTTPPAAPSNLVATAGNTQVGLSWSGSAGATSYNVKRSTTNGGPYTTVASPTGTSYTNTGLNNGTTYYYVVTAVNSAGESGNSNQASATPAQTGGWAPILVNSGGPAYTDTLGQSWSADSGFSGGFSASTASAIQNTSDPKLYQTERYGVFSYSFSVPTGNYNVVLKFAEFYWSSVGQRIFSVSINGTTVLTNFDIVAAAGAPLRAIDKTFPVSVTGGTILIQFIQGSADLPKVSAIEIAQASGTTPPAAPSNLVATAGNTQVGLSWSGSAGATSYNVKRSTTNGGPYTTVASPTGTSYTNTGLNNGTTYYYVVTAVNSAGESGNSNQASATPAQTGGWAPILVNSGGPAYTDTLGQSWNADSGFSGGFSASTASAIQNTSDPTLYKTEHAGVFSYSFSVPTGNYNVVLKFAEIYWSSVGQRIFSVSINGTTVLTNFDIVAAAGAPLRAIDKTFPVSVTGGTIQIQFIEGPVDLPKVSAIEITQ